MTMTMPEPTPLTLGDIEKAAQELAYRWRNHRAALTGVYGVPRGGLLPASMVARELDLPLVDEPTGDVLVVDDLVDSGATLDRYYEAGHHIDALYRKPHSPRHLAPDADERDGWLVFPWEAGDERAGPTDAVVRILEHIGEDPNRDGLADTPARVLRAYSELTKGYGEDPADHLSVTFDVACHELVTVTGIEFVSLCEHHMLPFTGTATIAYLPGERVVGLSKLARLVEVYARRLQVQERMTNQIADALVEHLDPAVVCVHIDAHHACMGLRGVAKANARMVTTAFRGAVTPAVRAEFMGLVR